MVSPELNWIWRLELGIFLGSVPGRFPDDGRASLPPAKRGLCVDES